MLLVDCIGWSHQLLIRCVLNIRWPKRFTNISRKTSVMMSYFQVKFEVFCTKKLRKKDKVKVDLQGFCEIIHNNYRWAQDLNWTYIVQKKFRRHPGRLLNVLCTLTRPPVSGGYFFVENLWSAAPEMHSSVITLLTHFKPMFHFYTPWKLQKTSGGKTFLFQEV